MRQRVHEERTALRRDLFTRKDECEAGKGTAQLEPIAIILTGTSQNDRSHWSAAIRESSTSVSDHSRSEGGKFGGRHDSARCRSRSSLI
jgi:hypothetical protein